MSEVTRRTFIKQVSAGAAGVAAVGALGIPSAGAAPRAAEGPAAEDGAEPVMAFVRDRTRGEVTLLVGHREIVHRDPELVRRLLRAAR